MTLGRMTPAIELLAPGRVPYEVALAWQRDRSPAVAAGAPEALALLEHDPVYTMGRRGGRDSLRLAPEAMPAPVVDIERGGDLTWHGPGQLVGYPILDLRGRGLRAADYVRTLEHVLLDVLSAFGIEATTLRGRPGVWVSGAKVAAIGVAIRGGVSMHGFALNVDPDLGWFDAIVPCGLPDATVTSMARLLPEPPSMAAVVEETRAAFERGFDATLVEVDADALAGAVRA